VYLLKYRARATPRNSSLYFAISPFPFVYLSGGHYAAVMKIKIPLQFAWLRLINVIRMYWNLAGCAGRFICE